MSGNWHGIVKGELMEKAVEAAAFMVTAVKHLVVGLGPPSVGRPGVRKTTGIWTSLDFSTSICHCV